MFEKKIYVERRQKLITAVGNGLIILLGNEESSMNYRDNLYRFRQDSSFLYFFGTAKLPPLISKLKLIIIQKNLLAINFLK